MSKMAKDDANEPIPLLGLQPQGGQNLNFNSSSSSMSAALKDSIRVVTLFSTDDYYVELGDATVQANKTNSHFIPGGFLFDVALGSEYDARETAKYVAVIGDTASGVLHISERS